jgi:hypothetical protein
LRGDIDLKMVAMKNLPIRLVSGLAALALSLSLSSEVLALNLFAPNHSLVIEKLPAEYIDYKTIDNISEFENHTIARFQHTIRSDQVRFGGFDGVPTGVEHAINKTTNNVIIKVTTKIDGDKLKYSFYKLDIEGNIIDSHEFVRNFLIKENTGDEQMVGATFLVNREMTYYSTWPLNGDKTRKPFIHINQDLAWSDEQVNTFYADVAKKSTRLDEFSVYEKINPQENKKRIRKVYYLNSTGKWYVLYGNSLKEDYSGKGLSGFNTLFKDFTETERFFKRYVPPDNISVPYFEKQTYSKYEAGNHNGSGTYMVYTWEGMAYYQLKVGNDTLKFKNKASLSYDDFGGRDKDFPAKETLLPKFAYYSNPNLKYSLFSVNDMIYVIKNK